MPSDICITIAIVETTFRTPPTADAIRTFRCTYDGRRKAGSHIYSPHRSSTGFVRMRLPEIYMVSGTFLSSKDHTIKNLPVCQHYIGEN